MVTWLVYHRNVPFYFLVHVSYDYVPRVWRVKLAVPGVIDVTAVIPEDGSAKRRLLMHIGKLHGVIRLESDELVYNFLDQLQRLIEEASSLPDYQVVEV